MTIDTFEYVVVGGGSAGCVLAARLSADPAARVLLLEAGPPDDAPEIRLPAAAPTLWEGRFARDDRTVPQPYAAGRSVFLAGGRTLGGGSSINGMVYVRGNRADYDDWRDTYGCAGWSYADLVPYFQRAEDGPLQMTGDGYLHPLSEAWLAAAANGGLPAADGGAEHDGVGRYRATRRGGRRWSAADAYLRPALPRPNLTVRTGAPVARVLLENGRAVGVALIDGSQVRARLAVLICAGAIAGPQLLMLSGIGPRAQLREHGIDVAVDAPRVGEGLQDHPRCLLEWGTPEARNLWEDATPEALELWQATGRGPMSSCGAEAGGFVRTRPGLIAPDLQIGVIPGPVPEPGAAPDRRGVTMLVTAAHVGSRGRVTVRDADPRTPPVVDPAYLSDEADLDVLVAGVQVARGIAGCEPLAGLVDGERTPGDAVSGDALRRWIRETAGSMFHPAGTCAMGGSDDAVCDPQLRVRGVDGLRVVDASVMPAIVRGNTNGPTIAIAERAADLIRG